MIACLADQLLTAMSFDLAGDALAFRATGRWKNPFTTQIKRYNVFIAKLLHRLVRAIDARSAIDAEPNWIEWWFKHNKNFRAGVGARY